MNEELRSGLKYAAMMLDDVAIGAPDNDYDSLRVLCNVKSFVDEAIDKLLE
jgi:hypothetical protein